MDLVRMMIETYPTSSRDDYPFINITEGGLIWVTGTLKQQSQEALNEIDRLREEVIQLRAEVERLRALECTPEQGD